ncbi:MAG: HepT-like ribonuclease domain-containing protein [Alphaproteobacteria bacterium]
MDDILDAIDNLERVLAGKTFHDFEGDWLLRRGVERGIEIISEASRRIPAAMKEQYPQIPWRDVTSIGNILRHQYHSISVPIIWQVIGKDLPPSKAAIQMMLKGSGN